MCPILPPGDGRSHPILAAIQEVHFNLSGEEVFATQVENPTGNTSALLRQYLTKFVNTPPRKSPSRHSEQAAYLRVLFLHY
jgi:hypothetical protein